jgi:hypothetical protein
MPNYDRDSLCFIIGQTFCVSIGKISNSTFATAITQIPSMPLSKIIIPAVPFLVATKGATSDLT